MPSPDHCICTHSLLMSKDAEKAETTYVENIKQKEGQHSPVSPRKPASSVRVRGSLHSPSSLVTWSCFFSLGLFSPFPVLVLTGKKINVVGDKTGSTGFPTTASAKGRRPLSSLPCGMVISSMGIFTVPSPRSNFTKE